MTTTTRVFASGLLVVAALAAPVAAQALDDRIPGHTVQPTIDGPLVLGAVGVGMAFSLLPIRDRALWRRELVPADDPVRDNFSRRAAAVSDGLVAASLVAPVVYLTGSTIEDADGDRMILYGQTVAVNVLLMQAAKRLVQRPRPYMYSKDPAVQRYAREHGDDGMMSFYSGHAALSFGAAITGAYLLGTSTDHRGVRAMAWAGGLAVATATANLRVRAGKHFYSDVVVGAIVGTAVGYVVPALHADGDPYVPTSNELLAGAAGILGGALLSQLLPLGHRAADDAPAAGAGRLRGLQLTPTATEHGIGFALAGSMSLQTPGGRAHHRAAQRASSAASASSRRGSRVRSATLRRAIASALPAWLGHGRRRSIWCETCSAQTSPRHADVPRRFANAPRKHRRHSRSRGQPHIRTRYARGLTGRMGARGAGAGYRRYRRR